MTTTKLVLKAKIDMLYSQSKSKDNMTGGKDGNGKLSAEPTTSNMSSVETKDTHKSWRVNSCQLLQKCQWLPMRYVHRINSNGVYTFVSIFFFHKIF